MYYPSTPPKICAISLAHRRKGSAFLALVLVMAMVSSLFSLGSAKVTQAAMNGTSSNQTTAAASQIAQGAETNPRSELRLVRYSAEQTASGVPIGTIIAWASPNNPTDGVWLDCNGQSCAGYAELVSVLGKSTVPDYRNQFLEGSVTPNTKIQPGLPNIEGTIVLRMGNEGAFPTNLFTFKQTGNRGYKGGEYGIYGRVNFNASRCSSIYGNSTTVQPPAVTVRYLIKAA